MAGRGNTSICDSFCEGCIYYAISTASCDYALFEWNGLRGCPAGLGCDKKETGKRPDMNVQYQLRVEQKQKIRKFFPDRYALYKRGLSDYEIGKLTGYAQNTITQWRQRNDLPANFPKWGAGGDEE